MSDLPQQGPLQQRNAHPHSGEFLEVLGKKAAAEYTRGAVTTLTEAVTGVVKQAQLSPEQVRRVVEFANSAAYLTEFKQASAPHHVIDFQGGPADVSEILKDLNDGGGGTVFDRGTSDYHSPPSSAKTASAAHEDALQQLFGAQSAPVELPYTNPYEEVIDLKDKLAGARDHLQTQLSSLEVMYAEVGDRVYHQVKQAALSDVSLGQLLAAWETVAPADEYIKVAFALLTPRLLRDGVFYSAEAMNASVDKTASVGIVNQGHPVMVEFTDFCTVLQKLAETRVARDEVAEHADTLTEYLKQASIVGGVLRGAERAGAAAHPLLDRLAGPTAADLGSAAIKYSPYAAGALAASEANTHIENSPSLPARAARGVTHKVLQAIPGTQQHLMHKYEVQNGQ